MNANKHDQPNTRNMQKPRENQKTILFQKSRKRFHGRESQKPKSREKAQNKNQSPQGKVAWDILSKPLFVFVGFEGFFWFLLETEYGKCWLTRILTGILCA